jgi:hypothetical protein
VPRAVLAAVAAVVVVGAVVGIIVAASGGKKRSPVSSTGTTTATTAAPATTQATTASTQAPATTAPASTAALAAVVPFKSCQDLAASSRGIPGASDEVVCTGSDVSAAGGDVAFYATFDSPASTASYLSELGTSAGTSSDCSTVTLGQGEALCGFQDQSSQAGSAVLYLGSVFSFGPASTSSADCSLLGKSTTGGASVVVWSYTGTKVVGGLLACSASVQDLSTMRSALLNGDLQTTGQ